MDANAVIQLVDLAILPTFLVIVVPIVAMLIALSMLMSVISVFDFGAEMYRNQINIQLDRPK